MIGVQYMSQLVRGCGLLLPYTEVAATKHTKNFEKNSLDMTQLARENQGGYVTHLISIMELLKK